MENFEKETKYYIIIKKMKLAEFEEANSGYYVTRPNEPSKTASHFRDFLSFEKWPI